MVKVKKELKKAYDLYSEFREAIPKKGIRLSIDVPKDLMSMGHLLSVDYDTTRGGKTELYRHEFAPGSRPLLCVNPVDGQLFIIKGRYHVTDRGIVDLTAEGDEIDD